MKKYFIILLLINFCSGDGSENGEVVIEDEPTTTIGVTMSDKVYEKQQDMNLNMDSTYTAVIKTNLGEMTVEFFLDDAPLTVNNFISLSRDGYYDEVIFHRVISGFIDRKSVV